MQDSRKSRWKRIRPRVYNTKSVLHTSARKSVIFKPEPSQASFAAALSFLAANWVKKPATILTASPLSLRVSMSSSCAGSSIDLAMPVRRSLALLPPLTATRPYSLPTYSVIRCIYSTFVSVLKHLYLINSCCDGQIAVISSREKVF